MSISGIAFIGHMLHFSLRDIEAMSLNEYAEYLECAEEILKAGRNR